MCGAGPEPRGDIDSGRIDQFQMHRTDSGVWPRPESSQDADRVFTRQDSEGRIRRGSQTRHQDGEIVCTSVWMLLITYQDLESQSRHARE